VFHQVKEWIGEADNMEAKDWGWSTLKPIQNLYYGFRRYFFFKYSRLTQRMPLVEQELLTFPEHLRSPQVLVVFVLLDL
jgi:hypothetical protein